MQPTSTHSPQEGYEMIMDALMEILNQYPSDVPAKHVENFDVTVRTVLGVPNEDSVLRLIVPTRT